MNRMVLHRWGLDPGVLPELPILGGPNTIREVMDQRAILMDIEKGGF